MGRSEHESSPWLLSTDPPQSTLDVQEYDPENMFEWSVDQISVSSNDTGALGKATFMCGRLAFGRRRRCNNPVPARMLG